jgi:serine/threonine-protein kinase RsbW
MSHLDATTGGMLRGRDFPAGGFPVRLEFSLAADVELIPSAIDRIAEVAVRHGYRGEDELALRLALQEALANAVVHGCGSDPSKSVHCLAGIDAELGILVKVRDEGPGFDVRRLPSPLDGAGLQADHGRGLHLIRQLMDEVWLGGGGSEIYLWKHAQR